MRSKKFKTVIIGILLLSLVALAAPVQAQDMGKKLGRGVVNILTGWIEVPKNIYNESVNSNVLVGLTWGTLKGAGYFVIRTVTGAYEVVTFPFPIPADYEAILRPEFVFTEEEAV